MVSAFEENCVQKEKISHKKDATKYAAEMGVSLEFTYRDPEVYNEVGEKIKLEVVVKEWRTEERAEYERTVRRYETNTGTGSSSKNGGWMKIK